MDYNIIISPRAQKEIENAIGFYTLHSSDAPSKFIEQLNLVYELLGSQPFLKVRYKNVRAIKIKKFPHSLYFIIQEKESIIKVLSCFHNSKNPNKRPKI